MPYYTRAGDKGDTGLCGVSKRVPKNSMRVAAYGDVDELNAAIGICRTFCKDKDICGTLFEVQNNLFVLGSDLSVPLDAACEIKRLEAQQTNRLEEEIDEITKEIGELENFILPAGTELSARLHFARAVCRRAERLIVALSKKEKINPADLSYINRLSSLLFVLARLANKRGKVKDTIWPPSAKPSGAERKGS
jgi:cob(I)alamin adenosyltransferase